MITIPFVDETRLVALVKDPATTTQTWDERAACADLAPAGDPYFPDDGEVPPPEALACCGRCPVALECLATALVHEALDGERFGWWGGLGPAERDAVWPRLDVVAPDEADVDLHTPAAVARRLRGQHRTIPAIAAELDCSERTVYRYLAASPA